MKYLDDVKVLTDKYQGEGVQKGAIGTILFGWLLGEDKFYVVFSHKDGQDYAEIAIRFEDLEVVRSSDVTDAEILEDLPRNDPSIWCKVEDGYIINLKGERKNKIPYDYNS